MDHNNYNESITYNTAMNATKGQLINRLLYTKDAIEYWTKNNDKKQIELFTNELNLIEKILEEKYNFQRCFI